MNDTEQKQTTNEIDVAKLARAIRFAFATIVFVLSCFSVNSSLYIGNFHAIFRDMFTGKPLPLLTEFMLGAEQWIILFSILLPLGVIGTLFLRNLARSFYILGALALVTIVEMAVLSYGLWLPFVEIIKNLQATP